MPCGAERSRVPHGSLAFFGIALALSACPGRREERTKEQVARSSPAPMPEALVAAIARAEASAQDALPPGPGRALVESRCAPCHSVAIVTQQRKTRAGWVKTVGVMKTWGAPLSPDEEVVLLEYLTTCFGAPEPP